MKNRTKFVIAAIINIVWYTLACLVATFLDKSVPDSLTVSWFSAWTIELGLLAGIKIKSRGE